MQRAAIHEILRADCILAPMQASDAEGAVSELVDALAMAGQAPNSEALKQKFLASEKQFHSGLENGLAIPHALDAKLSRMVVALGIAPQPIDFGASDGKKCDVVFLMAFPKHMHGEYVQALARIGRMMQKPSFHQQMRHCCDSKKALEIIQKYDLPSGQMLEIPE